MTRITFDVGEKAMAELSIYDVSGRRVATLVHEELAPGRYEAGGAAETKKIVLMR